MKNNQGFTLIEMIVTLVLVGILASVAGIGIVAATKGYLFAKDNSANSQKANLAMSRLNREFQELITIPAAMTTNATGTSIMYQRLSNGVTTTYSVGLDGSTLKIKTGAAAIGDYTTGDILIDNVVDSTGFTLNYYEGSSVWAKTDIQKLSTIRIDLSLNQPNAGSPISFSTTVNPRNNKNAGGASPASGGSAYGGSGTVPVGCFIATAAFGDDNHPTVLLLRDFRDRILLQFGAGRWFVNMYYHLSPPIAKTIEGRPVAMLATRIALLPLIGIAYLLLYHPWWVFAVLISLVLLYGARLIRMFQQPNILMSSRKGSILIGLIITMVIMAVLGAALTSFISSASFSQIGSSYAQRAYFLAESGFRYAASEFYAADDAVKEDTLKNNLDNNTFILSGNDGRFSLKIYPFYHRTTAAYAVGVNQIATEVPGTIPTELDARYSTSSSGRLKIGNLFYQYNSTSHAATTRNVTFTLSTNLTVAMTINQTISAAAQRASNTNSTITLESSPASAGAFPLLNGTFTIEGLTGANAGRTWAYTRRNGNILEGINALDDPTVNLNGITIGNTNYIVLGKFAKVQSTGIYAYNTNLEVKREILYNVPIGQIGVGMTTGKTSLPPETFDNRDNFPSSYQGSDTEMGSHTLTSIGCGYALDVTATQWVPQSGLLDSWSGLAYNWELAGVDLPLAWWNAGHLLSTDLQVKIKVKDPANDPFMAGVGFKGQANGTNDINVYSVQFLRAHRSVLINDSQIPGALIPSTLYDGVDCGFLGLGSCLSKPAIVFSKRQGGSFTLLAYKIFDDPNGDYIFSSRQLSEWSTILVRSIEAYPLPFAQDSGSGTTPFLYSDIVTVKRSGAVITRFRINGTPLVTSGSWAAKTAVGTLTIASTNPNQTTIPAIQNNDELWVGTEATYRTKATGNYGTRSHYIRVYYADASAGNHGTPNTLPDMGNRHHYNRLCGANDLHWPVDDITEWAQPNDYFTLVTGWTAAGGASIVSTPGTNESGGVILDNSMMTPSSGLSLTNAGIFLFTAGWNNSGAGSSGGGRGGEYFDDFGIQWEGLYGSGGGTGFLPPIQQ